MTFGINPIGTIAYGEIPDAGTPTGLVQAWNAEVGRTFLYEVTVFDRSTGAPWIIPYGAYPFGVVPTEALLTGELILRFSDTGYISGPTDSLTNTGFDGSVATGLQMTSTTPATPEVSRRATIQVGNFALANVDGQLDTSVRNYSVDGRRVRVLLGLRANGYDTFVPIFTGRMVEWDNDLSEVSIVVRDETYRLDKPMQTDIFDGSGGYNGGTDLTGKPRPMTFGQVLNISPPLTNAALLIFQTHHRAIQSVDAVYDRGAALTPGIDYATYALLAAAGVGAGTYATCLAFGLIRLGSTPSGLITADIHGDATGGYVDTTGLIAKRIVKDFGGLADTDLDLFSWSNFDTGLPGTIGWYQDTGAINVSDALDQIFGHCTGWWGALSTGQIQCGRLSVPTTDLYVLAIDERDDITLEILQPLSGTFPPRFRQRVGYQRIWTAQQDTDLAGAVTAARRAFLSQSFRVASSTDLSVQNSFLLATDPEPLQSLFYNQSDAATLASGLLTLYKSLRQTVRITLDLKGLSARLSATVLVTHARLNGGNPLPMLVMDITILADQRQIELVLWG
jgi:hypothetical protein